MFYCLNLYYNKEVYVERGCQKYMKLFLQQNKALLERIGILAIVIVFAYLFFEYLFTFIAPFFIGWLLSLIFAPFVNFLEKKAHVPRWIGSLVSILLLLGFFSSIVVGLCKKLYTEAQLFYESLPHYIYDLQLAIEKVSNSIENAITYLPVNIQPYLGPSLDALLAAVPSLLQSGGSQSFSMIKAIPNLLMILIVALISSYFFTKDKALISALIKKHFHILFEGRFAKAGKHLKYSVIGYIKTQLILMIYTFSACLVGLLLLRSPYALLLSVVISLIDALPFFGSGFILCPGAVIYLVMGEPYIALGYVIIYLCVNSIRQILQPKILGTQIGLHPLWILISMYVGLKCIGLLGMIIGPILAVLLKAIYQAEETAEIEKLLEKKEKTVNSD